MSMSRTRPSGWEGPPPSTVGFMLALAHNQKTRLENFSNYLKENGLDIRQPKQWELLRFVHQDGLGIIWFKRNNFLTWSEEALTAWYDFRAGIRCRLAIENPRLKLGAHPREVLIAELLARDGENCIVCGRPLADNVSIEHLLDLKFQGSNHSANLALAHRECNVAIEKVGSLREKIELIIQRRNS